METKNNNQPKEKGINYWKYITLILVLIIMASVSFYFENKSKELIYNEARTQGQLDIINGTSQTGQIFYLMNTSDASSINSTTINKEIEIFMKDCIEKRVCTWNQTKYLELTK